jgi:membrane-bound ClpP family serine protease
MSIFFTIGVIGFLYIIFASITGHGHDDIGHDMSHGDVGHDSNHEGGAVTSIFSPRVIAIFLMGFGGVGGVSRFYDHSYPSSCLFGFVAGIIVGGLMWGLLEFFARQQTNSLIPTSSLVGHIGTVDVEVECDRPGSVSITVGEMANTYLARSANGTKIGKGKQVRVVSTSGSDLLVEENTVIPQQ